MTLSWAGLSECYLGIHGRWAVSEQKRLFHDLGHRFSWKASYLVFAYYELVYRSIPCSSLDVLKILYNP